MAEDISNPLLALIREQGLIDDLQYEEVVAEIKRSNAPVIQLLQDFGIMKLDDILHVIAGHIGADVVSLKDREFPPELLETVPAKVAQMYHCLPVALNNGTVQVALADPLDPQHADEIHFAIKRDVQIVVADPAEINKAIDRLYGQERNQREFFGNSQGTGRGRGHRPRSGRGRRRRQAAGRPGQRGAHREIRQPRPATGHAGPGERHPFRAV